MDKGFQQSPVRIRVRGTASVSEESIRVRGRAPAFRETEASVSKEEQQLPKKSIRVQKKRRPKEPRLKVSNRIRTLHCPKESPK